MEGGDGGISGWRGVMVALVDGGVGRVTELGLDEERDRFTPPLLQTNRQQKIEGQLKAKKQGAAKFSREMSLIEKTMREKEGELVKKKPMYIKAKERTLHVVKRLEASK